MKILHAGNVGSGYTITKELRKKGIDAELIVNETQISGFASVNNPLKFDSELKGDLPSWFHTFKANRKGWKTSILKKMREFDLIHAYGELTYFAMVSRKPYVTQVVGDDIRVTAYGKTFRGFLMKTAYKRSKFLFFEWPPLKPYVEKLGSKNLKFIPKLWDTSNFSKRIKRPQNKKLVLFHPLGQHWKWKGNDKFLRAFVRVCKENKNVFLYLVNWERDAEKAQKLLDKQYVKDKLEIISGPIPRSQMANYMEKSDILVDQFNSGSFTRIGIEALNYGIPLLMNLNEELHYELYGDVPLVINAKNEDEIYSKLTKLINSKENLQKFSEQSYEWVRKHYDINKNVREYIEIYKKILKV